VWGKIAVACLMLAATAACANDGQSAVSGSAPTTQSGPTVTLTTPEKRCPRTHPRPQPVRIQAADEKHAATVRLIIVCGDESGQSVLLRNTSGTVWQVRSSGTSTRTFVKESLQSRSFRDTFAIEADVLPPGQVMLVRSPATVSWTLDLTLTAAWLAHDYLVDEVAHGSPDAFTRNTPSRTAIVTCLLGLYQAYKQVSEPPKGQSDGLLAGWNIRSSRGSCGATWGAVSTEDDRPPQKLEDVIKLWEQDSAAAGKTNLMLAWIRKLGPLRSVLT
jgi:hypothetical protein